MQMIGAARIARMHHTGIVHAYRRRTLLLRGLACANIQDSCRAVCSEANERGPTHPIRQANEIAQPSFGGTVEDMLVHRSYHHAYLASMPRYTFRHHLVPARSVCTEALLVLRSLCQPTDCLPQCSEPTSVLPLSQCSSVQQIEHKPLCGTASSTDPQLSCRALP